MTEALTEERVNEILDDLIERGLVVQNGDDILLSPPYAAAVGRTLGADARERARNAALEVGFEFPVCCVPEYEFVLGRLVAAASTD